MWTKLKSPEYVSFYEDFLKNREIDSKSLTGMRLMLEAVKYLQSKSYAEQLFGFTSMATFQVTSAPKFGEEGHLFVHVSIDVDRPTMYKLYVREIEKGWLDVAPVEYVYCGQKEFPQIVDELVGRVIKYTEQENEN